MNLTTTLGRLRLLGILEGLSFLLLLGIAMPLKYVWGEPGMVRSVGMGHGILFILYVGAAVHAHFEYDWRVKRTAWVVLSSIFPFGPFIAEQRLFRPLAAGTVG